MKLLDIYARWKEDIAVIEAELESSMQNSDPLLESSSLHLLKAGGKRIRPVFVLLSGQFGQYSLSRLKHIAVPLELIHMATLVHDDVIDDADTRRGQLTVRSKWNNRVAMYTGDYILGKALIIVTKLGNPDIHRVLSGAIVQMCIGEMEQIRHFFNVSQSIRDYLLRIKRKTALLIAISCQLGAMAAGAPREVCARLYAFGYNAGMAFQIRDDILDLCGTEKELGKPPGSDIRQGNITLPVLLALRENNETAASLREDIARIRTQEQPVDFKAFLHTIRKSEGMKQADELAARYIRKAIEALKQLPDIPAKGDLMEIARFIAKRSY